MYCIISNSSAYIATAVAAATYIATLQHTLQPEHFQTLGECTALHKSEVRRRKRKIKEY